MDKIEVLAVMAVDDAPAVTTLLADADPNAAEIRSLALTDVTEVLLAATVALHSAWQLVERIRRSVRTGIVIDSGDERLIVKQDAALPRGMVVVLRPDGDLEVREPEALSEHVFDFLRQRQT